MYLTDGCVDVGRAPDLYLTRGRAQIAPVRMTGNYGGEVLRRVRAFKPEEPCRGCLLRSFSATSGRRRKPMPGSLRGHPVSFAVFKQGPWHHYGILALEQTQLSLRSPFLDNDLVRTVFRAPQSALATQRGFPAVDCRWKPGSPADPDRPWPGGRTRTFLRGRLPRLSRISVQGGVRLRHGNAAMGGRIDHAFSAFHLERFFLGRHKIFHFRIWYGMLSLDTFGKCCSIRAVFPGHISNGKDSRQSCRVTSREIGTTPTRSTKC